MRRNHVVGIAFLVAAIALLTLFFVGSALGQVTAPCAASLNGKSANEIATPETALVVQEDGQVLASGSMPAGPVAYHVGMSFGTPAGPKTWTVKSGTASGNTWTETVDVAKFARYSVGIYRVGASSSNGRQNCNAFGFVNVVGRSAFSTPAGIAATAGAGLGIATVAVAGIRAAGETSAMAARITPAAVGTGVTDFLEDQSGLSPEEQKRRQEERDAERAADKARENIIEGVEQSVDFEDFITRPLIAFAFCSVGALFAGLATLAVLAFDGAKSLFMVAPLAMINGRLGWKLRISLMSLLGGLFAGLFLAVLLQQMGKVYPTQITTIAMLGGGLILGLVIPLIGRTFAVRRVNRAIERVNKAATPAPSPPPPAATDG